MLPIALAAALLVLALILAGWDVLRDMVIAMMDVHAVEFARTAVSWLTSWTIVITVALGFFKMVTLVAASIFKDVKAILPKRPDHIGVVADQATSSPINHERLI